MYRDAARPPPPPPRVRELWVRQYPVWYLPAVSVVLVALAGASLLFMRGLRFECAEHRCTMSDLSWNGRVTRQVKLSPEPPKVLPPQSDGDPALQVFTIDGPSHSMLVEVPQSHVESVAAALASRAPYRWEHHWRTATLGAALPLAAIVLLMWTLFPLGTRLRADLDAGTLSVRERYPFFGRSRGDFALVDLGELGIESVEDSAILEQLKVKHGRKEIVLATGPARAVSAAKRFVKDARKAAAKKDGDST